MILINGSSHGYFGCTRGVRQGGPLSPLLFCITEDALARWLDFEVHAGWISVNRRLPRMLLYADELIIFMIATKRNINRLHGMLVNYGDIFG